MYCVPFSLHIVQQMLPCLSAFAWAVLSSGKHGSARSFSSCGSQLRSALRGILRLPNTHFLSHLPIQLASCYHQILCYLALWSCSLPLPKGPSVSSTTASQTVPGPSAFGKSVLSELMILGLKKTASPHLHVPPFPRRSPVDERGSSPLYLAFNSPAAPSHLFLLFRSTPAAQTAVSVPTRQTPGCILGSLVLGGLSYSKI